MNSGPNVDFGGRGRFADLPRTGALRRSGRGPDQSRAAIYAAIEPRGVCAPGSHWAANSSNPFAAPMGMRMRLKASFDVSTFSAANQVILNALKKYGMIMADNGSSMYISGAPDDRWNNDDLHLLGNVNASDFEVVQMNPIYTAANVPAGAAPTITSFTASSQLISSGTT